jgi:signal transduction histidine kinase
MTIEQLEEKSGSLNQSAKKLYELLENLLEWTTLQSGKSAFDPEVHDMSELIFNTLYIHKNLLEQKNIKVTNKVDVNTLVKIDYKMIMSVLQNLVSNAIKFMDEEGELTITSDENEEMLAIAVSDTGAGISPENIDRIFSIDDHPSLANGRTRGAGLGLLLCKEFVEKHGGEIAVESQVGIGTTFTFTVPAAKDCIIPKS